MKSKYKIDIIIDKIQKYNYISFDIFDTLIKRNVNTPSESFNIVKDKYEKENNIEIPFYVKERGIAEKKSIIELSNNNVNIDDIYSVMNSYPKNILNKLKEIEIDTEIQYCQSNIHFKEVYDYCIRNNKYIIITSDMYLPKRVIKKILNNAGYKTYNKLYVSCEENHSKRNGDLYDYILKDLNIKSNDILHIGDSRHNDYVNAILKKYHALLIPKKVVYTKFKKEDSSILYSYINNNIDISKNDYYQLGFELLGPLLFNFCNWLIEQTEKLGIKDVYFLAREGNLLKQAFDILNNKKNIQSHYLYVSRRSTRVPLLESVNEINDVFKVVNMRRIIDVESFLINVGLTPEKYNSILDKNGLKLTDNIKNNVNFENFFNEIVNDIRENAKKEKINLIAYLRQEKFYGKIAICDVGWVGTMQNSLADLLDKNIIANELFGFYIGLNPEYQRTKQKDKMIDYIFSNTNYKYIDMASFLNLFESFFLAQHGTTLKYKKSDNYIKPVLDQYEYKDDEIEIFKSIQSGSLDFISGYKYNISIEESVFDLFNFGTKPSLKNVELFKQIKYVETKSNYFLNSHSFFYYLFHPKVFYTDFCNCSWKIGFLKHVFKIKINYLKIYKILKRSK